MLAVIIVRSALARDYFHQRLLPLALVPFLGIIGFAMPPSGIPPLLLYQLFSVCGSSGSGRYLGLYRRADWTQLQAIPHPARGGLTGIPFRIAEYFILAPNSLAGWLERQGRFTELLCLGDT